MPENIDAYTYRIGRTGRVEKNGDALTFVTSAGASIVNALEQVLNKLREAELLLNQGSTVSEASRKIGMFVRWIC